MEIHNAPFKNAALTTILVVSDMQESKTFIVLPKIRTRS